MGGDRQRRSGPDGLEPDRDRRAGMRDPRELDGAGGRNGAELQLLPPAHREVGADVGLERRLSAPSDRRTGGSSDGARGGDPRSERPGDDAQSTPMDPRTRWSGPAALASVAR